MKLRLNITFKLTLLFVLFAALLVAGVGALAYTSGHTALKAATIADFLYNASEKEAALQFWINNQQRTITSLAGSLELQAEVTAFITRPTQSRHDHLVQILQAWIGPGRQYLSMFVIDAETGQVIAATHSNEEGKIKKDQAYFIEGQAKPYVQNLYYPPELQQPAMTAAAPLHAPDGRVLGVLVGQVQLAEMNEIISRRPDLHQTDETFLVNSAHLFVTQPRLSSDPMVLRRHIQTEEVKRCLAGQSGTVEAEDYRGVPVIAIYRWLAERQLCLIMKIDQAEALAPVWTFGQTIIWIGSLTLLLASLLGLGLARTITRPVLALRAGVVRFGRGELETRLPETSGDELGRLARGFNAMAATLAAKETQLHRYTEELEQRVQERTATLQESEERLRAVTNTARVGLVIVNQAHCYRYANRAYMEILHLPEGDIVGRQVADVLAPIYEQQIRPRLERAFRGEQVSYELAVPPAAPDGETRHYAVTYEPGVDRSGIIVVVVIADITERKRTEGTLRESEEKLQTLFALLPVGISIMNQERQVIEVNPAMERIVGLSRQDLLAGSYMQWKYWRSDGTPLPPDEFPTALALKEGREVLNFDIGIVKEDRETIWTSASALPVLFSDWRVITTIVDITQRKQGEAVRTQLAAIIESSNDAIIGKTLDGVIVSWNKGAERQYGYTAAEVIGSSITIIIPEDHLEEFQNIMARLKQGEQIQHFETVRLRKDGRPVNVSITISPVKDASEKIIAASTIARDITTRKLAEEELRKTASELARSNAELEQFAYIASHDLQEPLRAVASTVQLLQRRYGGQLDARADEFIRHAVEGASRMQTLIADLLAFSRVATRGQPFQPTNCTEILSDTLANLAVAIRESGAVITHDHLPMVMADRTQLGQLFQNLIGNAIKFRGEATPAIHISVEPKAGEYLFSVRDNRIGLESQYFERIFVIFQRLHTRREYAGTGIGLAVCKKIVERHDGHIWVEAQPEQGSIFYFTLPNKSRPEPTGQQE